MKHLTFLLFVALLAFSTQPSASKNAATDAPTQFTSWGDTRYAFRAIGEATSAPPLLMITRYRANMDDWDPAFLDALAQDRRILVFNQSGISSSSGEAQDTIKEMAQDVANFVKAMGLEKVDVLGWSMGGFTAQVVAIEHPQTVRKVVLIGTGPAASEQTPEPRAGVFETATKPDREDGTTTYSDDDRTYLFFSDKPISKELSKQSMKRIDDARRTDEPVTSAQVMEAQTNAIQDFWFNEANGYFDKLASITAPTLIINGDNDAFFTLRAQELLNSQVPDAQLAIFPAAGHGPQHQFPKRVAQTISGFLQ